MDRLLFIGGLFLAAGAMVVLTVLFFVLRSAKRSLHAQLVKEYGAVLELTDCGIQEKLTKKTE